MPSVNERLSDAGVRHQVYLIRFGGSVAGELVALLEKAQRDLTARLGRRLQGVGAVDRAGVERTLMALIERGPQARGEATTIRLARMREDVRLLTARMIEAMEAITRERLEELAAFEIDLAARRLSEAVGVDLGILRPAPELLRAAVDAGVSGTTLRRWFKKMSDDHLRRTISAVNLGLAEGDTIDQIIRRVRNNGAVTARSAAALARTAANATANRARGLLYSANDDLIKGLRWTATLDSRTSPICSARDGKIFPLDKGARPPAHPNCRSVMVPVTKSWAQLAKPGALKKKRGADRIDALFRKKLRARGLDSEQARRVMMNARASMNGQVPARTTYQAWLKRQPAAFQDSVLGKTKGALFRRGGLTLDRFVDMRAGQPFTLEQLRRREAQAWARANLDDET